MSDFQYNEKSLHRQILAAFDAEGIFVYQAFKPVIADAAAQLGTFGRGFNLDRMTWIKPSLGWMLYRSHYASRVRQERILKIKVRHEGFSAILEQAVPTTFEPTLFATEESWRTALKHSAVRYQWDPDRDLCLHRMERRALQIGLEGTAVRSYVEQWILAIEDITLLAHRIRAACAQGSAPLPPVPDEQVYEVGTLLRKRLVMTESA